MSHTNFGKRTSVVTDKASSLGKKVDTINRKLAKAKIDESDAFILMIMNKDGKGGTMIQVSCLEHLICFDNVLENTTKDIKRMAEEYVEGKY